MASSLHQAWEKSSKYLGGRTGTRLGQPAGSAAQWPLSDLIGTWERFHCTITTFRQYSAKPQDVSV